MLLLQTILQTRIWGLALKFEQGHAIIMLDKMSSPADMKMKTSASPQKSGIYVQFDLTQSQNSSRESELGVPLEIFVMH